MKSCKKKYIITLISVLLLLWIVSVCWINHAIDGPVETGYTRGESFSFLGMDVEMKNYECIPWEEAVRRAGSAQALGVEEERNYVLVTVEVTNNKKQDGYMPAYLWDIEYKTFGNGNDFDLAPLLLSDKQDSIEKDNILEDNTENEDSEQVDVENQFVIPAGQSKELYLVFTLPAKYALEDVAEKGKIVLNYYPKFVYFKLGK